MRPACLSASCAYRKTQQSTNSSSFTCRLKWFQKFNYLWAPILKAGASCQFPHSPKALCALLYMILLFAFGFLILIFLKLQHSCSRKAEAVSGTWCHAGLRVQQNTVINPACVPGTCLLAFPVAVGCLSGRLHKAQLLVCLLEDLESSHLTLKASRGVASL